MIPYLSSPPKVWTIGGSDSSGGAGIQADLKVIHSLGALGCSVLTSVTAQSASEVKSVEPVSESMIGAQIVQLKEELAPNAIKIGMLGHLDSIRRISKELSELDSYIVYDPVFSSSSGYPLLDFDGLMRTRNDLFPKIHLLTPNLPEAEKIVGYSIESESDRERAAKDILGMGVKSVLIKGGHAKRPLCQDYYSNGQTSVWITSPRYGKVETRGTGCALSTAIATARACGFSELDSIVISKSVLNQSLRQSIPVIPTRAFLRINLNEVNSSDFPWISSRDRVKRPFQFPSCGKNELGFYPIVDRLNWLQRLLPLGVKTAQLRIKDLRGEELENEIKQSIALAKEHQCRLFINDYWDLALKHEAYGVHLGQEDLETADIQALFGQSLRLGISTHSYAEAAFAHSFRPSYIAIGPIFPTTLKKMKYPPQGIDSLSIWKKLLDYPLVAIGGISLEKASAIQMAGAQGIAVVSDVVQNPSPESRALEWLRVFRA